MSLNLLDVTSLSSSSSSPSSVLRQPFSGLDRLYYALPCVVLADCFWVLKIYFFRGGIVSLTPNPQPGGPGIRIYIPRRQGGPAIPLDTA
jgi:hypothetical protein